MSGIEVSFVDELTPRQTMAWSDFVLHSRHGHPQQLPEFGRVAVSRGRKPVYMLAVRDGKLVAVGIYSMRSRFTEGRFSVEAECLSGPVFDDVTVGREVLSVAALHFRARWVGRLRVRPYYFKPEGENVLHMLRELNFRSIEDDSGWRDTGTIELSRTDDEYLESFTKSARREVRRAQRQGVEVRSVASWDEAGVFFEALDRMNQERGIIRYGQRESRTMYDEVFQQGKTGTILAGYHGGRFLGGLLLLCSGYTVHTVKFVIAPDNLAELSNLRLAPLIWFHGMRWGRDRGCSQLDVEGYAPPTDAPTPLHFVHKYKSEFVPTFTNSLSQFARVCRPGIAYAGKVISLMSRLGRKPAGWLYELNRRAVYRRLHSEKDTQPVVADASRNNPSTDA